MGRAICLLTMTCCKGLCTYAGTGSDAGLEELTATLRSNPCAEACHCFPACSLEALNIPATYASHAHSDLQHCRKEYSGGALLSLNLVAGTESSAGLLAAVWPALAGADSSNAVPGGMWPGSSAAWPSPDADTAAIGQQLSQRLKRAQLSVDSAA